MKKKKDKKKQEAKKRALEFSKIPRKKKCPSCGKPMINSRKCESCKKKKRLQSKASKRGKEKNYYLGS